MSDFIQNLYSSHPHDTIRADVLVKRMIQSVEQKNHHGFSSINNRYNFLCEALQYASQLSKEDCTKFSCAVKDAGFELSEEARQAEFAELERSISFYYN